MITVRYSSIDGYSQTRKFKTLSGARRYANKWVGPQDVEGGSYAVSDDGVGKVTWQGTTRRKLFGDGTPTQWEIEAAQDAALDKEMREQAEAERAWIIAKAKEASAADRPKRDPRCTCSDDQLVHVGCDCEACR